MSHQIERRARTPESEGALSPETYGRFASHGEADFPNRVLSAMRHEFGGMWGTRPSARNLLAIRAENQDEIRRAKTSSKDGHRDGDCANPHFASGADPISGTAGS